MKTTYLKALTAAQARAMRADERVFVIGEDVAEGGPYTATAGLAPEQGFGLVWFARTRAGKGSGEPGCARPIGSPGPAPADT